MRAYIRGMSVPELCLRKIKTGDVPYAWALYLSRPWYLKKNLRSLYLFLLPAALGVEMSAGYDGSVINGLQAVSTWVVYFDDPRSAILGIMSAAFALGSVIALPIVPYTNDSMGRKPSVIIGAVIVVIGVIIQAAAVNIWMFLLGRILLGVGIPFGVGGASQLLAELAHPKERAIMIGLFSESWYAGAIVAAGVTLGTFSMPSTWSWRIPLILQVIPTMITLTFIWGVPESPRWLVANGKSQQALRFLTKYHGEGEATEFVLAEYKQIEYAIGMERDTKKGHWVDFFRSPGNRRRGLISCCVGLFLEWSGNGLFNSYLPKVLDGAGITSLYQQNAINVGLQSWNLLTGVTGAFATRWLERKQQYLIAFTGMALVFCAYTAAGAAYAYTGNTYAAGVVVATVFIYAPIYNMMMPLTYIYITEIYQYELRAKGVSITQFSTRAGTAFNQFVNPIGMENLGWKYSLVYCIWTAIEVIIIFFVYPDVRGMTLEQIAVDFDGTYGTATSQTSATHTDLALEEGDGIAMSYLQDPSSGTSELQQR